MVRSWLRRGVDPWGTKAIDTVLTLCLFAAGILCLVFGGDYFVRSSVSIASHARLPRLLIGTTLVSLATTAPELTVSATASLRGNPGLAIGNAVGSAIANIGLILGLLCILRPMVVHSRDFRAPGFYMLAMGVLLGLLTVRLSLDRAAGALLLTCGAVYLVLDCRRHRRRAERGTQAVETAAGFELLNVPRSVVAFVVGAGLVGLGSWLLCRYGVELARLAGAPPILIGLTLVAVGTSVPELVTAIHAAHKGVPELSLGNIVGANIFNVTLVTGTAASISIKPLAMTRTTQVYNFPAMVAIFIVLLVMARTGRRLTRREGGVLLAGYVAYIVGLLVIRG